MLQVIFTARRETADGLRNAGQRDDRTPFHRCGCSAVLEDFLEDRFPRMVCFAPACSAGKFINPILCRFFETESDLGVIPGGRW